MCLQNVGIKKIAERDIVCYKVIVDFGYSYRTLYKNATVNIGKTYRSRIERASWDNTAISVALHSFTSKKSAVLLCNADECIAKCIIPKGSVYYKGVFPYIGKYIPSYASNRIKYVELLR